MKDSIKCLFEFLTQIFTYDVDNLIFTQMFGGNVKGGEIKGKYPNDLTLKGEQILSRGRVIPTTPWDACFRAISLSLGVKSSDLAQICPNCRNFPSSTMFRGDELFNDVEPPGPTASPTEGQSTTSPTLRCLLFMEFETVVELRKPTAIYFYNSQVRFIVCSFFYFCFIF